MAVNQQSTHPKTGLPAESEMGAPPRGYASAVLAHASDLTRAWGPYMAYASTIVIISLVTLPWIRSDSIGLVLLFIVVSALIAPLAADRLRKSKPQQ